jgi:hypothetical protein
MRRRRATSRIQAKIGREHRAEDYPLDGIAPDDLPVRDIREDQEEWSTPDSARTKVRSEHGHGSTETRVARPASREAMGTLLEAAIFPHVPMDPEPTPTAAVPEQQVDDEAAELPAQSPLPGLELADLSGKGHAPKRIRRSRRSGLTSDKSNLRGAQMELWPDTESPNSET